MLTASAALTHAQEAFQSVGLVLSGGGARGVAHIGVIQALEDNDIPIDYVAGTSAGAIVGGLYASGYTPAEMMDLFLSPGFADWSTGTINPRLYYAFAKDAPTPALINIPIPTSRHADTTRYSSLLPSSLIGPLPMSFAFMQLFSAYTAQCGGDFDRLFVPYRCVASNSVKKRKQVMSHGDLGDAIRSSMSFPIVFQPISIDGDVMYDGGVYDNFPVDVMRSSFAPDIMLGFDVSTNTPVYSNNVLDQLETLIMQGSNYDLPANEGIKLHIDLNEFGLLDFPLARQIYQIGYDRTIDIIDSIKARVHSRQPKEVRARRRAMFKARTPYIRFAADSVSVRGVGPQQARYIKDIFDAPKGADTFGITHARDAFYRAITPGLIHTMQPTAKYNPSTGLMSLSLDVKAKDNLSAGVGGYVTSSTNSFLYLGAKYKTMSYRSLNASLGGWVGQSYMAAQIDASLDLATPTPSRIGVRSVVSRQKYYESDNLFYQDKMPTFILGTEAYVQLLYSLACHRNGVATFGVGYGGLWDRYYRSNREIFYQAGRDRTDYKLGQLRAEYRYNTLDNEMFPVSGHQFKATALGILGDYESRPEKIDGVETPLNWWGADNVKWMQLELRTRNFFPLCKHFVIGLEGDVMLSTRKLLPGYNASIVNAPSYNPTPSSYNAFNPAFRANSFLAAGLVPVWRMTQAASLRGSFNLFLPLRKIEEAADYSARYGRWLSNPSFFGELAAVYTLPFASVSAYVNYQSYPARNWNCGLTLGLFFLAPKYLR